MNIKEMLKGVTPGGLQTVGYMQIMPLITEEMIDDKFVLPSNAMVSTSHYGTMKVSNNSSEGRMILPFGAGYVVSQSAQDHATPTAKVIGPNTRVTIDNAACIQETQGGYVSSGKHQMTILPWCMKENTISTMNEKNYSKLWPVIKEFNISLGLSNKGHLEFFLKQFNDELNEFISQFEIVYNQVGAIILMNGYVVGIERAPNHKYWADVWQPLIRECYGSLALQYAKKFGNSLLPPKTRVPIKSININSLDNISDALDVAEAKQEEIVKKIIRKFVNDDFERTCGENNDGLMVDTLKNKQFVGQVVKEGEKVVYLSLVITCNWMNNKEWNDLDNFII